MLTGQKRISYVFSSYGEVLVKRTKFCLPFRVRKPSFGYLNKTNFNIWRKSLQVNKATIFPAKFFAKRCPSPWRCLAIKSWYIYAENEFKIITSGSWSKSTKKKNNNENIKWKIPLFHFMISLIKELISLVFFFWTQSVHWNEVIPVTLYLSLSLSFPIYCHTDVIALLVL